MLHEVYASHFEIASYVIICFPLLIIEGWFIRLENVFFDTSNDKLQGVAVLKK